MKKKQHRLGVSEVNLVVRNLKLESASLNRIGEACADIDKMYGLDDVTFDKKTQTLSLAYDASRICLDGIEEVMHRYGIQVSHDWWTGFKEGYYKFVDENVHDNASHEPWSCHKGPSKK